MSSTRSIEITGLWLHSPMEKEKRRQAIDLWKRLFCATEGGYDGKACGVIVVNKDTFGVKEAMCPYTLLEENTDGIVDRVDALAESDDVGAILSAVVTPQYGNYSIGDICIGHMNGFGLVHEGRLYQKDGLAEAFNFEVPEKDEVGTSLFANAIHHSGILTDGKKLEIWKKIVKEVKGNYCSAIATTSGDLYMVGDTTHMYISCAPKLGNAVFFTTDGDTLMDDSLADVEMTLGFFKQTIKKEELINMVIKGDLAWHGAARVGKETIIEDDAA